MKIGQDIESPTSPESPTCHPMIFLHTFNLCFLLRDLSVAPVALWHRSRQWLHLDQVRLLTANSSEHTVTTSTFVGTLPSRHRAFVRVGCPNLEALHKRTSLTVSLGSIECLHCIIARKSWWLKSVRLLQPPCWNRWRWSFRRLVDARCAWAPAPRWSKTPPGRRPTTRSCQDPAVWARREPPHRPSLQWYCLDGGGGSTKERLFRMKVRRKMGWSRGKGRVPDWRKDNDRGVLSNSIFGFCRLWRNPWNVETSLQKRKGCCELLFPKISSLHHVFCYWIKRSLSTLGLPIWYFSPVANDDILRLCHRSFESAEKDDRHGTKRSH